ncbi:DUF262 domain-containing protein [Corynebacterium nuruki]|uniref:DUF262 domain-containing protein n=1 Tax=Corynebacterium nuruki TaxID=1032851 RepID=UPI0039BEDEA0
MKGQPTEITEIYNKSNFSLVIPVYQRNYDWSTPQCARLFDDLEELADADRAVQPKHFFGAVVGKSDDFRTWVVIDGQQRLTTVSLLILAIVHSLNAGEIELGVNPGDSYTDDKDLAHDLVENFLLNKSDPGDPKFKLKPVKNDAAAYRALFGSEEDFREDSNVTANYRYFRKRLAATTLTAWEVWDAVTRLEVMHLDLEPHDDPQQIFESLNSTGLNLSESDKIRNLVLMNQKAREQKRLYEERWNPIEENVDNRTDWFIRWYLTAKTNRTPKEADVFEAFKQYLRRGTTSVSETMDDMFEFSKASRALTHADTGFPAVDRRLRRANLIIGDVVHPFLMQVLRDAWCGIITENDLDQVILIIESYLMRRMISQIAANALNKIFATAYTEIRKLRTDDQSYASLFTWVLRRRDGGNGRFPTDEEFREGFETRNAYQLRTSYRQYLFDVLENGDSKDNRDIADKIGAGDLSIEHIMPQSLTSSWREMLGPNATDIHETWKNRIGNLTVTGYNSSYSNSSFSRKKEMENGFNSSPYRLNADVKSTDRWDEATMTTRSHRLAEQALDYWALAETNFRPPEAVRPTEPMGTDTSFRNRSVTGYEFGDVSGTVSTWSDLLPKVLDTLLQQHRAQLLAFADKSSAMTLHPDQHAGSRGLRVVDPGLGVWVNTSTGDKITLLRRVFSALSLDPEELVFTLRPVKESTPATNTATDNTEAEEHPGVYAALTKFSDEVAEAAALKATPVATEKLRAEFADEFEAFRRDTWMQDLGGQNLTAFTSSTGAKDMTAEQDLAVISGLFVTEQLIGPGAVHQSIIDGSMSGYLERLAELG